MKPDETDTRIVVECELPDPPEKVWRALTEPRLVAAWLLPNDLEAEPGRRFRLQAPERQGGRIDCRVLEAEPGRLLRYSWRGGPDRRDPAGRPLDTVVSFELTRTARGGTHLRLVHSGFPVPVRAVARLAAAPPVRARMRPRVSTPKMRLAA